MLAVLVTTFPFFALVLCGYLAVRVRLLPLLAIPGLNMFVLYFALPCLLFRFGANTAITQLLDPFVILLWIACAAIMVGGTIFATREPFGWNDAAFGALVGAFSNTGFMGVPLLVALLGARAAGTAILTILVDLVFTTSLCVALSRLGTAGTHGAAVAARNALRSVVANPLPWSIILGAIASALRVVPVAPVMQTIGLLADAASPVALFTIGAVLARSQMTTEGERVTPMPPRHYVPIALAKLLLHPVLVFVLGTAAVHLGVLDHFTRVVLVLVAALPSASNVSVLAERFGADNGRIARIILVSTALAFLTFSAAVALMAK
ncbi:MAG TPA: AEC family transporter [Casimicrobiaceae bacterium]|nr:AEC family transporter [Casimicrobiaceae bacterium]